MPPNVIAMQTHVSGSLLTGATPDAMQRALRAISQRSVVASALRAVLDDAATAEAIVSRSYTHSNGFDKIVLVACTDPEYSVRLHIWWPSDSGLYIEDIHNHSWDFASEILTGAYAHQIFEVSEQGGGLHHYRKVLEENGGGHRMEYVGKCGVQCVFDSVMTAGSAYSLQRDVLHGSSMWTI